MRDSVNTYLGAVARRLLLARAAEALAWSLRLAGKAGRVVYDFDAPRGEGDFSE